MTNRRAIISDIEKMGGKHHVAYTVLSKQGKLVDCCDVSIALEPVIVPPVAVVESNVVEDTLEVVSQQVTELVIAPPATPLESDDVEEVVAPVVVEETTTRVEEKVVVHTEDAAVITNQKKKFVKKTPFSKKNTVG